MGPWWFEVWNTVHAEFSDLPNVTQTTRVVLRLGLASILGAVLGLEREERGKAAGMRTHMLVALGSALFVLIPQQAGVSNSDLTRVIQGLIAGIGFLGAGCIIHHSSQEDVHGLTTAAGIWVTAAIGVATGIGREASAVLGTLLALAILTLVPKLSERLRTRK